MRETSENDLYMMLGEIKGDIRIVLNNTENLSKAQANHKVDTEKRLNSHSDRIVALEQFRWKMAGAVLVIPVVISIVGAYIKMGA